MGKEDPKKGNTYRKPHEVQRRRVLEFQHFDLMKFKITKDGVDVTHHEKVNESFIQTTSGEYQPHPDLKAKMDLLKPYMATRLGLLEGWDFSREHLKSDLDLLQQAIKNNQETIDRCNVNGLTFLGNGDKYGVTITGSLSVPKGGSFGLAVPKITFSSDKLGYEKEVMEICEQIKSEVYQYRFQAKKAQLDIETEAEKIENPDLFKEPELISPETFSEGMSESTKNKLKGKKPLFKDQVEGQE